MLALTLLLLAIGWLLVAAVAGFLAYKGTRKRWVQVVTIIVVLWLPFWDVIPGWILYQKAVREVGGVRIYKTVEAEGYLDRALTDCRNCWTWLRQSPYRYIEVRTTVSDPMSETSLTPTPGYYEFRIVAKGGQNCGPFEALKNVNALRNMYSLKNQCVSVVQRASPVSQYEYQSSGGWKTLREIAPIRPIESSWQKVRDRVTGEVIAEAYAIRFVSWVGSWAGLPRWQYTDLASGKSIGFDVNDVVDPK